MERKILCMILLLFFQYGFAQEKEINGTIIVYYTQKNDTLLGESYTGYCLDSIRFITNERSMPVGGYLYGREKFVYRPLDDVNYTSVFLDKIDLFVKNYGDKVFHKGGEIFEKKDEPNRLYITFNIVGRGFYVVPKVNSVINDSLSAILKKNQNAYKKQYGIEPCPDSLNEESYILLIDGSIEATPLSKRQLKCFEFFRSSKTDFINYGIL